MAQTAEEMGTRDFLVTLCGKAGRVILESLGDCMQVEHKGEVDLVTQVDLALERMIVEAIRDSYPGHSVLSEEGAQDREGPGSGHTWIVDPLDGTTNYVHGYPLFCVSLALASGEDVLVGAIYDPLHDEFFYAEKGGGATLNDQRIGVSSTDRLISSLLSTGFPYDRASIPDTLVQFNRLVPKLQGVRRSGSLSLDLAYVAAGRLDGHWELHVKPWDVAAGGLLVMEAGGRVSGQGGTPWSPFESRIVATNGKIHDELLAVLGS